MARKKTKRRDWDAVYDALEAGLGKKVALFDEPDVQTAERHVLAETLVWYALRIWLGRPVPPQVLKWTPNGFRTVVEMKEARHVVVSRPRRSRKSAR